MIQQAGGNGCARLQRASASSGVAAPQGCGTFSLITAWSFLHRYQSGQQLEFSIKTIVLLETMKSADREHRVFKLQFAVGEFDMVIYDEKENCCEIFEIKHSGKQVPAQYRHLLDQEKCDKTEQRFGPIRGRYVLYRGEDVALENGVHYRNVERYLNDLPELNIAPAQEAGIEQTGPVL